MLLPIWPPHCRQAVAHAALSKGQDPVGTLAAERQQLDFANQRAANCGAHYDRLKASLEAR